MRLYDNRPAGTVDRARTLRRAASPIERRLLRGLREAFPQLKWRHQAPVGPVPFYADILCFSQGLVIEIHGDSHADTDAYDATRTALIEREGYPVIRFPNGDVMEHLEGVLAAISGRLKSISPPGAGAPGPRSRRERGRAAQPQRGEGDHAKKAGEVA